MSQWYLSKNGQALGPLEKDKVIALIKSGDVTPVDLVYKTGDAEWKPLSLVGEFASFFNAESEPQPQGESQKNWVLLKKIETEKGREYKQLGPFAEEQVLDLIDAGDIRFTDFAWRKGLETWVKISELEPFSQPLPSSPSIDMSLYEKTEPGAGEVTVTGAEKKASLTHLVSIEKFNHEKTMVAPLEKKVPINNEDFATESGVHGEDSESDISLWSLEPPSRGAAKAEDKKETPREASGNRVKAQKKAKKKAKKKKEQSSSPLSKVDPEVWQWAAAVGAVVLSVIFFYLSFNVDSGQVVYDEDSELNQVVESRKTQAPKQAFGKDEISSKMQIYQQALESAKKAPLRDVAKQSPKPKILPKPVPKVPIVEKKNFKKKETAKIQPKKVASKKRKISQQTSVMKKSKKKVKKVTPKKKVSKKRISPSVSKPSGGRKLQSFYKQRDRKALFYSSLKAETLVVEIEGQYRKLGKNKAAWRRFYGQWRKKVKLSLAKDIRSFPKRKEKYAYPKLLASFKKDYNLFYKYGESFNAKVTGSRGPSGAPKNLKAVFSRHKKQAQGLGL